MRTAVHGEVVRALQHLTALPLSGPIAPTMKKCASTSVHAANSTHDTNGNHSLSVKGLQDPIRPLTGPESHVDGDFNADSSEAPNSSMSPRKGKRLRSLGSGSSHSNAVNDIGDSSGKAAGCDHTELNLEAQPAVVFMDKSSARAHADAITSHTHRAFQKVCSLLLSKSLGASCVLVRWKQVNE